MDCIVHRVAKSRTRLNNFHFNMGLIYLYMLCGLGDLSSPNQGWNLGPGREKKTPNANHWAAGEFHENFFFSL